MKRYLAFLLFWVITLTLAGCGSDDPGTNGTLTLSPPVLTPLAGGIYNVLVTATYAVPPSSSNNTTSTTNPSGTPITITASIYTLNGTPRVITDHLSTNSAGVVTRSYDITQINQAIFVDITATTGGLSQSTSVSIPSL